MIKLGTFYYFSIRIYLYFKVWAKIPTLQIPRMKMISTYSSRHSWARGGSEGLATSILGSISRGEVLSGVIPVDMEYYVS